MSVTATPSFAAIDDGAGGVEQLLGECKDVGPIKDSELKRFFGVTETDIKHVGNPTKKVYFISRRYSQLDDAYAANFRFYPEDKYMVFSNSIADCEKYTRDRFEYAVSVPLEQTMADHGITFLGTQFEFQFDYEDLKSRRISTQDHRRFLHLWQENSRSWNTMPSPSAVPESYDVIPCTFVWVNERNELELLEHASGKAAHFIQANQTLRARFIYTLQSTGDIGRANDKEMVRTVLDRSSSTSRDNYYTDWITFPTTMPFESDELADEEVALLMILNRHARTGQEYKSVEDALQPIVLSERHSQVRRQQFIQSMLSAPGQPPTKLVTPIDSGRRSSGTLPASSRIQRSQAVGTAWYAEYAALLPSSSAASSSTSEQWVRFGWPYDAATLTNPRRLL